MGLEDVRLSRFFLPSGFKSSSTVAPSFQTIKKKIGLDQSYLNDVQDFRDLLARDYSDKRDKAVCVGHIFRSFFNRLQVKMSPNGIPAIF